MLTYENKKSDNGNFVALVVAMMTSILIGETESGDFVARNPITAVFKFLRSLGNAENKGEREALKVKLTAEGLDAETIDKRLKAVKRDKSNFRRDVSILERLSPNAKDKGLNPIVLTVAMERKLTSLLKNAVGFNGHVDRDALNEAFQAVVTTIAESDATSVTVEDLGINVQVPARVELANGSPVAV